MATISTGAWKTILAVLGVVFAIGFIISGFLIPLGVFLILGLALWGGAMLYRSRRPPEG